jgi:hypothetical protein
LPQRTSLDNNPFYRTAEMRREDRCSRIYGQPQLLLKSAFCVRNDYGREPDIVLMGDSHSNMYVPGVQHANPGASTLQIGASACTYLRNTEFWNDNRLSWRQTCPPLTDVAWRSLGSAPRVVILAARIPMYTATAEEYAATFDFVSPKHFESPDFPGASAAETYERALERDAALLLAQGHEVVIVLPVPAMDFSPRSCLRFRPVEQWMDAPDPDGCTVPRERVEARQAAARALVRRVDLRLDDPDLHVVDPLPALCDAAKCRAVIGGRLMYLDDNHLSADGSRYVWPRIQPAGLRGLAHFRAAQPGQVAAYLPRAGAE